MFSLIITIISIVLVGLLAVATIYYGGDAFSNRGDEARADRVLNEGQQLAGAAVLAKNDGVAQATPGQYAITEINPEYVTGSFADWAPKAGGFDTETTNGVCAKLTEKVGTNDKITVAVDLDRAGVAAPGVCTVSYLF